MRVGSLADIYGSLNNLIRTTNGMGKSFEKLSSGMKINTASDDPAGLVISTQLRSAIAAVEQKIENIDALNNKYASAEGYLSSMQGNLQEMRSIALAASNDGAMTEGMRAAYQNIINRNVDSYNTTIADASYGSFSLLDGSSGSVADLESIAALDISDPAKAAAAVEAIDTKIKEVLDLRADIGARQKYEFGSQINNLRAEMTNLTGSESAIRDTDMAAEYSNLIASQIRLKAGMSVLAVKNSMTGTLIRMIEAHSLNGK